jgi:hypothetical protein
LEERPPDEYKKFADSYDKSLVEITKLFVDLSLEYDPRATISAGLFLMIGMIKGFDLSKKEVMKMLVHHVELFGFPETEYKREYH